MKALLNVLTLKPHYKGKKLTALQIQHWLKNKLSSGKRIWNYYQGHKLADSCRPIF